MWVKSHGRFYYKGNGEATRMLGIAVDINEQKQAESALWETESRFRNVADRAPGINSVITSIDPGWILPAEPLQMNWEMAG